MDNRKAGIVTNLVEKITGKRITKVKSVLSKL